MQDETLSDVLEEQDPVVRALLPGALQQGVLIPLKTTLELREDHSCVNVLITRTPVKCANAVITLIRSLLPEEIAKGVPHLRRCTKPSDLPVHLKSQFMNESAQSRQIHTGKSNWIYILLGPVTSLSREELTTAFSAIEGFGDDVFLRCIPVPMLAPTSQVQAAMWSLQFWPTVYRKTNPLGPHPSQVGRASEEITRDAAVWMTLAHEVALRTKEAGYGEPMGAVIVQREAGKTKLVALAGDARWLKQQANTGDTGNPMAHAVLRAISMVAQKLVRAEKRDAGAAGPPILEFEAFQDRPLVDAEKRVFDEEHPSPDGYLCHGLELYLTHEPCIMCSMAILHSRMGRVVFCRRMPLTGGLCSEDRNHGHPEFDNCGSGRGLGLFWRRELNWSLLAWEWEVTRMATPLPAHHNTHA